MIPTLTDDAVSRLPLRAGRAELLEEIMTTVAPDRQTAEPTEPPVRRRGWLVPAAAAVVVAGIAVSSLGWPHLGGDSGRDGQDRDPSVASALELPQGQAVVLDAPGWEVESLGDDGVQFRKGDAGLEITSYPEDGYGSYVADREHIVDPPAPGQPIEVLGRGAQMWAYSKDDHTAIREVADGRWLEVRGQGMDRAAYLALLDQLRLTSETEFDASLPDGYVTGDERSEAGQQIVDDIEAVSGAGLPDGASLELGDGESQDRYQFGAEVVGAYACAWLEAYENAQTHGQPDQAAAAQRVLGTSRDWPILAEMDKTGDYPEVLWQLADEAVAGRVPDSYREGLGCR
jgi:hypothetical protein